MHMTKGIIGLSALLMMTACGNAGDLSTSVATSPCPGADALRASSATAERDTLPPQPGGIGSFVPLELSRESLQQVVERMAAVAVLEVVSREFPIVVSRPASGPRLGSLPVVPFGEPREAQRPVSAELAKRGNFRVLRPVIVAVERSTGTPLPADCLHTALPGGTAEGYRVETSAFPDAFVAGDRLLAFFAQDEKGLTIQFSTLVDANDQVQLPWGERGLDPGLVDVDTVLGYGSAG